jgi:hypothetical protein
VLDIDIKGFFDNIDHALLMKAVRRHTQCRWMRLYIERWLNAPVQMTNGMLVQRDKGTPQGGVISPLLRGGAAFSDTGVSGFLPGQYSNRRADIHEKAKT